MSPRDRPDSRDRPSSASGTRALSDRPLDAITVDTVLAGELGPDDVRIHPDTLRLQADVAERHGNPHLAANLRRAAELTAIPDDELLAIYEALRPGRSTRPQLEAIAARLESAQSPLCAALVREALEVYERRGLLAVR
jgi:propanediol dehydratase small subunit